MIYLVSFLFFSSFNFIQYALVFSLTKDKKTSF